MRKKTFGMLCRTAILFLCCGIAPLHASFIFCIYDDGGGNVVESGSGTLNTSALIFSQAGNDATYIEANHADIIGGTITTSATTFTGATGPTSFGPGTSIFWTSSSSGDRVGVWFAGSTVIVELATSYVSGSPSSNTATWSSSSLSSLGLTTGSYTWSWGSEATADSIVLNIGTAPQSVPEPGALGCMLLGLAGMFALLRSRSKIAG